MTSPISLSIIIPSNESLIQKDYIPLYGKGTPIQEDKSLWITTIYDMWDTNKICNDINNRLLDVGAPGGVLDIDSPEITIINEGLRILSMRMKAYDHYLPILTGFYTILENKLRVIYMMNQINEFNKSMIINRMEIFIKQIENGEEVDIDKEKKELNQMTLSIKNAGATTKILREIGKKMRDVYAAISKKYI